MDVKTGRVPENVQLSPFCEAEPGKTLEFQALFIGMILAIHLIFRSCLGTALF